MNYERRYKRFVKDLLDLIEQHMLEWNEAEAGIYDIDEVMDQVEVTRNELNSPVDYPKSSKKRPL